MAKQQGPNESRITIPYFDGINAAVQPSLGKITELSHAENARAPIIGVLEKRQGQAKVGTATNGAAFYTRANYALASQELIDTTYQGVFRVSATQTFSSTLTLSVFDSVLVTDVQLVGANTTLYVKTYDYITVSEADIIPRQFDGVGILDGTSFSSTIYSLTALNTWYPLTDAQATGIIGANFDDTIVDGSLVLVNGRDHNRMISSDGLTVTDATEVGSLFSSPRAKKTESYKSRIYLANFIENGVKYGTTVLRSSYPLGIVALVNGDVTASTTITVTDTNYFYTDAGMNLYDIYRGNTLIYANVQVNTINETSVIANSAVTLLSADEVWIAGTYTGAKQYRWVNNGSVSGRSVKQYDTFKLSGGEEDEITLFETIGNVLMIGNKNTMMSWNDYTLQNFDLGVGCVASRGSVKLLGTLYFLHYSGVYSTTGAAPVLVSRKIERYIRGATKSGLENAASGFKGTSAYFSIGNVTLYNADGSFWKTLNDVCIEYNVVDQKWYVHTNVPAEEFLNFIKTDGTEQLLISHGGTGKSVKEFLVGSTDDGKEIFFRADTNEIQIMKEFEYSVEPKTVVTNIHRGSLMTTMISLDGEPFYQIQGTNKKGITPLKVTARNQQQTQPVMGRIVQLSFRDSSKQLCRLVQVAIVYVPTAITELKE